MLRRAHIKKDTPRRPLRKIILSVPGRRELPGGEQAVREGMAIAAGMKLTRDLGKPAAQHLYAGLSAEQARELAARFTGMRAQIFDEAAMEQLGMGALLAVSRGSIQPAQFIRLDYRQAPRRKSPMC